MDGLAVAAAGVLAYLWYPGLGADMVPPQYPTLIMVAVLFKLGSQHAAIPILARWCTGRHVGACDGGLGGHTGAVDGCGWCSAKRLTQYSRVWLVTWAGLGMVVLTGGGFWCTDCCVLCEPRASTRKSCC